jgi:hypothetical protein
VCEVDDGCEAEGADSSMGQGLNHAAVFPTWHQSPTPIGKVNGALKNIMKIHRECNAYEKPDALESLIGPIENRPCDGWFRHRELEKFREAAAARTLP